MRGCARVCVNQLFECKWNLAIWWMERQISGSKSVRYVRLGLFQLGLDCVCVRTRAWPTFTALPLCCMVSSRRKAKLVKDRQWFTYVTLSRHNSVLKCVFQETRQLCLHLSSRQGEPQLVAFNSSAYFNGECAIFDMEERNRKCFPLAISPSFSSGVQLSLLSSTTLSASSAHTRWRLPAMIRCKTIVALT